MGPVLTVALRRSSGIRLAEFRERLPRVKAIPQVFIDGEHIGGFEDLRLRLG